MIRRFRALLFFAAVLSCLPAGCVIVQQASVTSEKGTPRPATARTAKRPAHADAQESNAERSIWPARWGDDKPGLGKGIVVPIDGPLSAWEGVRLGPWHHRLPRRNDEPVIRALAKGRADAGGYRYRMEGAGAYIFDRKFDAPDPDDTRIGRNDPSFMFVFASGQVEPAGGGMPDEPRVDIERTWFAFYDHRRGGRHAEPNDPGKGTVVLMPGLFGIPVQVMDTMVATMRTDGWNVVRMLAPPARFVESKQFVLDPGDSDSPRKAAAYLMNHIAETAYAAEAAVEYATERRPALADLPTVLIGGSAGALALPAAMRRAPDRYDAAVIIAGGANLLDIVLRSSYSEPIDALRFSWKDNTEPTPETRERFFSAYLKNAPLDGANAAPAFAGKPVLMIQGMTDEAVPSDAGDRLWKTLGEPERWMVQGNHMTVFMSLWLYTPKIMAWLDQRFYGDRP